MRLIGYLDPSDGPSIGVLEPAGIRPLGTRESFWADPWSAVRRASGEHLAGDLPRTLPIPETARVLCVGLNYAKHVHEGPFSVPDHPTIFARWTSSLAPDGSPVAVPPDEDGLDWEGELAVIVGRTLTRAESSEEAAGAVFAYAPFNDVTARRAQKLTTQWTLGKNVDGSGTLGALVTADEVPDPSGGLRVTTTVNGTLVQDGSTIDLLFPIADILALISRTITLRPGDLIATGTPEGVGYARTPPWLLHPGDEVEVTVEAVGSVRTPITGDAR